MVLLCAVAECAPYHMVLFKIKLIVFDTGVLFVKSSFYFGEREKCVVEIEWTLPFYAQEGMCSRRVCGRCEVP